MFRNTLSRLVLASSILVANNSMSAPMSFASVWSQVAADPYTKLPSYHTNLGSFTQGGVDVLAKRANSTLSDDSDILPYFQKLVHPVGICFKGTWTIDQASPYTGYFASGARGLIVVRASEAMGNAERGDYRSFGLAGKIFPTTDASDSTPVETANFFTVDDLGGTTAASFLDLPKLNEPKQSVHPSSIFLLPVIARIAKTFAAADSNPGIRQVYPIAELGLNDPSTAVAPHWMSLIAENTERVNASDFRNELRLRHYPAGLRFGIYVSEQNDGRWTRLGRIVLSEEALTSSCDHRLHFQHPRNRD